MKIPKIENHNNGTSSDGGNNILLESNFKVWCKEHYGHINRSECITYQKNLDGQINGECLWCGYFFNTKKVKTA
jgi:hypothetical protein